MSGFLLPGFGAGWQAFSNQGLPLAGGKLYTYVGGSVSTRQATGTDSTLGTSNSNPIILDSTGRPPNEIWGNSNSYKLVLHDSNDNPVSNGSWDYVSGVNNVSSTVSEWIATNLVPTYISTTQFSVPGNQTALLPINRRIQYFLAGVPYYGFVSNVTFDGVSTTTVTVTVDVTNLAATLNAVSYGFLNSVNPSLPQQLLAAVASQTHVAGNKATPVAGDEIPLIDSAAAFVLKKMFWSDLLTGVWTGLGALIAGGVAKTTPVNADSLAISDSAATGATKTLTFTNLAAWISAAVNSHTATSATSAGTAGDLTGTPTFFTPITASLGADVSIIAAAIYYDGPSVAQGTSGKWFVSGTVIVIDSGAATAIAAKLWDGTTVLASTEAFTVSGTPLIMSLSGVISAPTANLRISVKDISNTTGRIAFNTSGNSKDSTITAFRIG